MKKKILIIEDEKEFVVAIRALLESEGYEVLAAGDGLTGLHKAKKENPNLIILDVMMPKLDGYKVCRLLKFDIKYKDIPILMLTAKAQEQDKLIGMQCGADAYFLKSESPDGFLAKVKKFLG
jgi:DNA-binding response OmpR family regulator